ncbi:MAG TPA: sensor histidine kinase [Thermoanaerobaculia bacterium]|nr:sensor histidine kinase [Thermoanaerobaculia bacterium]
MRDVALDLRPSMLDDLGLEAALRWYAERFARQSGIAVHLAADFLPPIDAGHATVCFRVVQEALTNIARHANARNVWLDAHASSDTLQLTVRDDGVGFDVAAARRRALHGESLGILGMEERVAHVGGTLRWTSARGSGTTVLVRIPLPRSDAA